MNIIVVLTIILIIVALVVSILGSISGVGGGVLFVPILLFLLPNYSFSEIKFVSTLLVFASAFINVFLEILNKRISWTLIILILITTIPTIFLGIYLSSLINPRISQIIVIIILIIVCNLLSFSNLLDRRLSSKTHHSKANWYMLQTNGISVNIFKIILITFLGGLITALTGMGGGPILMPLLLLICNLSIKQAAVISHTIIAITAFVTLCFSYQYFLNRPLNLQISLPMICGVITGTLIAYSIKNKITNEIIIKWILIILIWISIIKMIVDISK